MVKRLCCYPACQNFRTADSLYCEKHQQYKNDKAFSTAERTNDKLYNTAEWQKLRKETIYNHPFCEVCGSEEDLEVHHKQAARGNEELFFNPKNLMVVCASCHRKITAKEIRERKKQ